ncbi:hypothetical protein [Bradyrhizobium sp. Bra78]|uniref:hypothetical protein n=1 Tax=Bradyrhizobium sp. Bra78 TaxID=2926010 RepID=UPI0021C572CA|nr:hypothetical protein [Bradyrhizobium sp. Bra78]
MANSHQGIAKDQRGEEQPRDKQRAQTVHKTDPQASRNGSPSREATRDPKLNDESKTPGSGAMPDGSNDATG